MFPTAPAQKIKLTYSTEYPRAIQIICKAQFQKIAYGNTNATHHEHPKKDAAYRVTVVVTFLWLCLSADRIFIPKASHQKCCSWIERQQIKIPFADINEKNIKRQ